MDYFQQRRKALGLSQAELARRCGVSEQRISEIARGQALPKEWLAERLELHLETEGLPRRCEVLSPTVLHRLNPPRPFELPAVNCEGWQRMERHYRDQIDTLGLDVAAMIWMQSNFTADSGVEGVGAGAASGLGGGFSGFGGGGSGPGAASGLGGGPVLERPPGWEVPLAICPGRGGER